MSKDALNRATTLRVVEPPPSLEDTAETGRRERDREQERRMWSYADELNDRIRRSGETGVGAVVPIEVDAVRAALAREEAELRAQATALDALIGSGALAYPEPAHQEAVAAELRYPEVLAHEPSRPEVDTYGAQLDWLQSAAGRAFLVHRSLRRTA